MLCIRRKRYIIEKLKEAGYEVTEDYVDNIVKTVVEKMFNYVIEGEPVYTENKKFTNILSCIYYVGKVTRGFRKAHGAKTIHDPSNTYTIKIKRGKTMEMMNYHFAIEGKYIKKLQKKINDYDYFLKYIKGEKSILQTSIS